MGDLRLPPLPRSGAVAIFKRAIIVAAVLKLTSAEFHHNRVYQRANPLRRFAEMRLLALREALLPHGYHDYRVNINGPPPGTGLIKRYGAARYAGGSVEWVTP
jgi:hypothetical protein